MPKRIVTEDEKREAYERAEREFPGNDVLRDLHYIRYVLEIEWRDMTMEEIQAEIQKAKEELGLPMRAGKREREQPPR